MELRVLNYFLTVAREENFTKAAQILHVTQPTLSRQIAQLEEELEVKLFIRSNHNIVLTEEGMMLKRRAGELLTLAEKTKRDFLHKEQELAGTIPMGSGEFQSTYYLSKLIAGFREKHPMVTYELYSGNAGNVRDYIERGLLDIGLMSEPIDIRKYEFIPMPVKEQWGAFVREDSALAAKEFIRPEDLLDVPIVTPIGDFNSSNIGTWFGDLNERINIIAKGNLLYNISMLAENHVGVVLGINLNCKYGKLKFIPLEPKLETGTALAWKREQIFSSATTSFIDYAKKYLKDISNDKL